MAVLPVQKSCLVGLVGSDSGIRACNSHLHNTRTPTLLRRKGFRFLICAYIPTPYTTRVPGWRTPRASLASPRPSVRTQQAAPLAKRLRKRKLWEKRKKSKISLDTTSYKLYYVNQRVGRHFSLKGPLRSLTLFPLEARGRRFSSTCSRRIYPALARIGCIARWCAHRHQQFVFR